MIVLVNKLGLCMIVKVFCVSLSFVQTSKER